MNDNISRDAQQEANRDAMIETVNINMGRWLESLMTRNPKEVADQYSDDATFLPTVSGEFKKGKEGAEQYFIHFLEKDPIGEIVEQEIQMVGENHYVHSGMYNFEIGPDDNRQVVEARFTFVWKLNDDGAWEIIHHHSSVKPKSE